MDESKKTKKGGAKVKFNEDEAAAAKSSEIVFGGAASGNDMVNFGGDDENQFDQKSREPNIIRKFSLFPINKHL